MLVKGEPNVSYICSRYYRAPELIFGATDYTCDIGKPAGRVLPSGSDYDNDCNLRWQIEATLGEGRSQHMVVVAVISFDLKFEL